MMRRLMLGDQILTLDLISQHLDEDESELTVSSTGWERIDKASKFFRDLSETEEICYGLNTNLGDLAGSLVDEAHQDLLQRRLILSHAVGVGPVLSIRVAKALMLLRMTCFLQGASSVRPRTFRRILDLYNRRAVPEIYESGSLGASGDLAPLAHFAAFLLGLGWGYLGTERLEASEIHARLNMQPISLDPGEGLSLINGTSAMCAVAVDPVITIKRCLDVALVGIALLLDVSGLPLDFLEEEGFQLKAHPGAQAVASRLRDLLGRDRTSFADVPLQAQYSFRCAPLILGPLFGCLEQVKRVLEIEINSANDNPLYLPMSSSLYHGGHFHGHCVSVALDQLRIAAVHLSGLLDRQLDALLDERRAPKFPAFLALNPEDGHCGFEGAQYLATSLHIENKALAQPRSILSIPTNGGNQDYVSLGMQSALATHRLAENLTDSLTVYLAAVHQACILENCRPSTARLRSVLDLLNSQLGGVYADEAMLRDRLNILRDKEFINKMATT